MEGAAGPVRTFWRERGRPAWQRSQWFVLLGLWVATLAAGYAGFADYAIRNGQHWSPGDLFYLSLQLFTMDSGSSTLGATGWLLEAARLAAPLVAALTAVHAVATLVDRLQQFRLRGVRDHVVIVGLGRKGFLLARAFLRCGERVVVIERNADDPMLEECRAQGAIVLTGDAIQPDLLRRARVAEAKHVVAICGEDCTNAKVSANARELTRDRQGKPLVCSVHVGDPRLCLLLREREMESAATGRVRLQLFNVYESGARAMLHEFPPFAHAAAGGARPPHLLIVGTGPTGRCVAARAAEEWRARDSPMPLTITLVDPDAGQARDGLLALYPFLGEYDVRALAMGFDGPEFHAGRFLPAPEDGPQVTAVYVCIEQDSEALASALTLMRWLPDPEVRVVVRTTCESGLSTLLHAAERESPLRVFGLLDRTCQPGLLAATTNERLAQAIHAEYVRQQESAGRTPAERPAMVAWEALPEAYRESNRRQADHISVKLGAIRCGLSPYGNGRAAAVEFTEEEVERMARMEHERWREEREREGWRAGPRDEARKCHPELLVWEKLPEPAREQNRAAVRALPAFLAGVGLSVYRTL